MCLPTDVQQRRSALCQRAEANSGNLPIAIRLRRGAGVFPAGVARMPLNPPLVARVGTASTPRDILLRYNAVINHIVREPRVAVLRRHARTTGRFPGARHRDVAVGGEECRHHGGVIFGRVGRRYPRSKNVCSRFIGTRIMPYQFGKSPEIVVRRAQRKAVLDRECRKMRVRNEIAMDSGLAKQGCEYAGVAFGRSRNPDRFVREPGGHLFPRTCHRQRSFKDARVRG